MVLPDSKTVYNGSMYSSSVTTGDFENYVARDVVAYIDAHYRTIPKRTSRGLVGHSMGGYGASRIGMKHSDVFGSLYIMSPCCMSPRAAASLNPEDEKALEAVKTPEDSAKLTFFQRAQLATAAAWSPDPNNPPGPPGFAGERWCVPHILVDGQERRRSQLCIFIHRRPATVSRHSDGCGRPGPFARGYGEAARRSHKYGIANSFEVYSGTHTSRVADRFQNHVIPFFSKTLCFKARCQ